MTRTIRLERRYRKSSELETFLKIRMTKLVRFGLHREERKEGDTLKGSFNRGIREIRGKRNGQAFPASFRVFRVFRGCSCALVATIAALAPVVRLPPSLFNFTGG